MVRFGKGPNIVGNGQLQVRYAVLTGGPRVDVDSPESRIIYIRKLLKKLRNQIKSLYGNRIEFVFAGLEITLKRDSKGTVWCHPHFNVIYCTHERLLWGQLLDDIDDAVGGDVHWRDCGIIRNPAEVIKYVTKQQTSSGADVESELAAESLLREGDRYGNEIGLLDLTPDELWQYVQQCGGYTNAHTGEQKRPKIAIPMGSFRLFNTFVNDPATGVKIVVRKNEHGVPEYVPQAKNQGVSRKKDDERTPGNDQPPEENVIITETGVHPSDATYLATSKLLIKNYTEYPITRQGQANLERIRKIQAQRQNQAIRNGATLVDQKGRRTDRPFWYLPTPELSLPAVNVTNILTLSTIAAPPVVTLVMVHGWSDPLLKEQTFIMRQTSHAPPRMSKTDPDLSSKLP